MSSDWSNKVWDEARYDSMIKHLTRECGKLSKFTNVGGYPIFYVNMRQEHLCSECADEEVENLKSAHVNWEYKGLSCDECSTAIEHAYD